MMYKLYARCYRLNARLNHPPDLYVVPLASRASEIFVISFQAYETGCRMEYKYKDASYKVNMPLVPPSTRS